MELAGMLLDDAAELSAHVEAQVFDEGWAVLPLVRKDPQVHALERAFVNGAARELAAEAGVLRLEAQTERGGDTRGRLELLLTEEPGRFKLSGGLRLQLPAASRRTDEYVVELHLPEVFNDQWKGGSLSPCDASARAADFVSQLPPPGKQVCLRQALAFEPPTAAVAYVVDLAGKYWAGR